MKLFNGLQSGVRKADFTLNAVSAALVVCLILTGLLIRSVTGTVPGLKDWAVLVAAPLVTLIIVSLFPRWMTGIKMLVLISLVSAVIVSSEAVWAVLFAFAGVIIAPAVQKVEEWERAIVLRFGRFYKVRGPGLFLLLPFADRVSHLVDLRTRVTDFTAQETLTLDSVTVTVDALCFWLVWDAEKAVCEVQQYEEAVVLSSKTALRNAVSKHDLSAFLARGEEIEREIREEVDAKTTDWGITVQHIEITDIQIPQQLQDSLSRLAQMEREKQGRILLAEAEIEIAGKLSEAARIYGEQELAMKLKSLSILNEGLKAGNSMMLVPNSITEELKSRDIFGLQALAEQHTQTKTADDAGEKK